MGQQINEQLKIHCLMWVMSPFPLNLKFFLSTYNFTQSLGFNYWWAVSISCCFSQKCAQCSNRLFFFFHIFCRVAFYIFFILNRTLGYWRWGWKETWNFSKPFYKRKKTQHLKPASTLMLFWSQVAECPSISPI